MASLDKVFEKAIEDGSILGAVLLARDSSGKFNYSKAFGRRTFGNGAESLMRTCCMTFVTTIMEWCHLNQKQWQDCPRQPCEAFFSKVFEKFHTLEYVPFFDPDGEAEVPIRKIMENPILFQNIWPGGVRLPTDPQAAVQQYGENQDGRDLIRHNINEWRALQKLYRDAGWESKFNGELFDNRRRDLLRAMDDFQGQSSRWYSIPEHRKTEEMRMAEREFRQRREEFWAEIAGEYYL
ncbi:hypothetical protein CFD26_100963 [Aspergillus turcosus]|uniref:Uncharacterized protein n=1 Tax=Aspergillus turcosus TaxID=1245748 RepID=A0A3R7IEW2_9EURO|nr:hypothetical protein CFD26_100963 [Aspergillus turcosus]